MIVEPPQFQYAWVCPTCGIFFLVRPVPQGAVADECRDCHQKFWRHAGRLGVTARPGSGTP